VRTLVDYDLFGEISMVYGCKRTCTVVSKNYCTLATISRPDYVELKRDINLSNFESQLKKNMCFYDDPIKLFIEYELNKIAYFQDLSPLTKNDVIFSMEHTKRMEGDYIVKSGHIVDKLVLIQEGIIQIDMKLGFSGNADPDNVFIIERLSRGAIINSRSFLPDVEDFSDTDFLCITNMSAFVLSTAKMRELAGKRSDLKNELDKENRRLQKIKIGLDYIIHNNAEPRKYKETLLRNSLRVRLKNCIV
jgi:hypothetical protein